MKRSRFASALEQFLTLPVGAPITGLFQSIEIDGNLIPPSALVGSLSQLNLFNIADTAVNFQSTAGASLTISGFANLYQKLTNGGAVTVTLDSAYNIVNNLQNPFNGESGAMSIFSSGAGTVATPTLSDTAVTLAGTTSISAGNTRVYQWQITQLATTNGAAMTAGTTFTSIAQVGSTNNFTVTLVTNAIVPVVGQVIFLGVTAGTLPPGWYPINKVTSATSFVIATPTGVVWTATAATVPGTTTVPSSQYQSGYTVGAAGTIGIFSPLLTLTAMEQHAATV